VQPAKADHGQKYVCYFGDFLCPIIAGEPLSYCSGACYSKFMYSCQNNALQQLPRYDGAFSLTVSNPTIAVNGAPISACGQHWWIGGSTCSYCPSVVPANQCPPGTTTAMFANSGMDVEVPGGQQWYLDPSWNVGYTQAHSAFIPPGSIVGGFAAYQTGGLINLNPSALGWVACPPTAAGGGGNNGKWNLIAKNSTNAANLGGCYAVNLKVNPLPTGTVAAWQYT
jgi:Carbohydrate binding